MPKYQVIFVQTEGFMVTVDAKNLKEAGILAQNAFEEGDHQELGDCRVEIDSIKKLNK